MGCCPSRTNASDIIPSKPNVIYLEEPLQTNVKLSSEKYINFLVDSNELKRGSFTILDSTVDRSLEQKYASFIDSLENPQGNMLVTQNSGSQLVTNENNQEDNKQDDDSVEKKKVNLLANQDSGSQLINEENQDNCESVD